MFADHDGCLLLLRAMAPCLCLGLALCEWWRHRQAGKEEERAFGPPCWGNRDVFSGCCDSSLGRFKVPNGRWQGWLHRLLSPSCAPTGGCAGLPNSRLHAVSAFLKPARSVDAAIQLGTKVYWFEGNPVLLRCVGNTLMSAQFARVNRDNGFGHLHWKLKFLKQKFPNFCLFFSTFSFFLSFFFFFLFL
jgi:hypothetical protein